LSLEWNIADIVFPASDFHEKSIKLIFEFDVIDSLVHVLAMN